MENFLEKFLPLIFIRDVSGGGRERFSSLGAAHGPQIYHNRCALWENQRCIKIQKGKCLIILIYWVNLYLNRKITYFILALSTKIFCSLLVLFSRCLDLSGDSQLFKKRVLLKSIFVPATRTQNHDNALLVGVTNYMLKIHKIHLCITLELNACSITYQHCVF